MEAVLHGPSGQVILGAAVLTIGRAPDNRLVINDFRASAHHAEIQQTSDGSIYSITDLGSTNGTFVNEQMLNPNVPRPLTKGDKVRIGDTIFTYEVSSSPMYQGGVPETAATVLANPGYQPTVAAPPPSLFDAGAQQGNIPTPGYSSYAPPPSPQNAGMPQHLTTPAQLPTPPYLAPGIPAYTPPAQPQKRTRRGPWIIAAIVVVLLLILGVFAAVVLSRPTPAKTLDTFCTALTNRDYQTAYNQFGPRLQRFFISEANFARLISLNPASSCSHGAPGQSGDVAQAPLTIVHASGQTENDIVTLLRNANGDWRIEGVRSQ